MARFFVSYSRSVKDEVQKVVDLLRASGHDVWWDGDIPIMADWWATILDKIEWCEVFIFVTSEKSVESPYCIAELRYANDRQRPILPFMLEDPATLTLPHQLPSRNQWLMYDGNPARMLEQINTSYNLIEWEKHSDINTRRPPEPNKGGVSLAKQYQQARQYAQDLQFNQAKQRLQNIKRLDYGEWGADCDQWLGRINSYEALIDLVDHEATHEKALRDWRSHVRQYGSDFDPYGIEQKLSTDSKSSPLSLIAGGSVITVVMILIIIAWASGLFSTNDNALTPVSSQMEQGTDLAQNVTEDFSPDDARATGAAQAFATLTALAPTNTPTITQTPSNTPISSSDIQQTAQAEIFATETSSASTQAVIAQQTQNVVLTEQFIAGATATYIVQLSLTPLATPTPTPSPTNTPEPPTATVTPDISEPEQVALEGVTSNAQWENLVGEGGYVREFNGVEMVLVPAGSFEMGSTEEEIAIAVELCNGDQTDGAICSTSFYEDEAPIGNNVQRFNTPLWMDKTEVSRAQYQECIDVGVCSETPSSDFSSGSNQPINRVTWFQAQEYCEWRYGGDVGRLPTEAEWEYAARGVDRLVFPWGNEFDGTLVNHCDGNCRDADWSSSFNDVNEENDDGYAITSPVGNYSQGASWIGALDMSGNLWEWTLSEYVDYPYNADDGRNDNLASTDVLRVVRGGAFANPSNFLRSADRDWVNPSDFLNDIGFRCVRSYDE